jgi:hypothetical protein
MPTTTEKRSFRLLSTSMINTPGILRWAQNGYKFKRDRKALLNVFTSAFGGQGNSPSADTLHRLLLGEITWTEEQQDDGSGYTCVCFTEN